MLSVPGCSMPASSKSSRLGPPLLPPVLVLPAGLLRSPDRLLVEGLTDTLCVQRGGNRRRDGGKFAGRGRRIGRRLRLQAGNNAGGAHQLPLALL